MHHQFKLTLEARRTHLIDGGSEHKLALGLHGVRRRRLSRRVMMSLLGYATSVCCKGGAGPARL